MTDAAARAAAQAYNEYNVPDSRYRYLLRYIPVLYQDADLFLAMAGYLNEQARAEGSR